MFNTTHTLRPFVSVAIMALWLSATVMGQNKTFGSAASGGVRRITLPEAQQQAMAAKVAASVQKSFLELQRTRQILDLTQQLASMVQAGPTSYQSAKLEAQSAWAKAEADMFQAQLDHRLAYTQLKSIMGGQ
jgi:hypothetical protein